MNPRQILAEAAINALVALHENPDTVSQRIALKAVGEGRPAFWSTATYNNQKARNFVDLANEEPLLSVALAKAKPIEDHPAASTAALLGCLIPLNREGVLAILLARGAP